MTKTSDRLNNIYREYDLIRPDSLLHGINILLDTFIVFPKFEAGREKVGKKGVVRDPAVHEEVINTVIDFVREIGFYVLHLEFSPIKGPEGNIEYLIHIATKEKQGEAIDVSATVKMAHNSLDK